MEFKLPRTTASKKVTENKSPMETENNNTIVQWDRWSVVFTNQPFRMWIYKRLYEFRRQTDHCFVSSERDRFGAELYWQRTRNQLYSLRAAIIPNGRSTFFKHDEHHPNTHPPLK